MMELPLFPLNTVLFPQMPLALHIFEERYKQMIGRCIAAESPFGVVLIREGSEVGMPAEPYDIGTTAHVIGVEKLLEGRMNIIASGRQRFRLMEVVRQRPYLVGRVELEPHALGEPAQVAETAARVRRLFADYMAAMAQIVTGEFNTAQVPDDEAGLAYAVAAALEADNSVKQRLLAAESLEAILCEEAARLPREIKHLHLLAAVKQSRKRAAGGKIGPFSQN
ncbi:MAG: LON peptidase substrate-binding domain-containing protein [Chloroflexi bacterium]|nr:LON peptidase substrate-binding domain-containing protein [Chloroflexota bacterium]